MGETVEDELDDRCEFMAHDFLFIGGLFQSVVFHAWSNTGGGFAHRMLYRRLGLFFLHIFPSFRGILLASGPCMICLLHL